MMHNLGVGVGLRRPHFDEVMQSHLDVDWFEIISENFIQFGGKSQAVLDHLTSRNIPFIPHGLGLSLGDPFHFDLNYARILKSFMDEFNPPWFSDHLCFSSIDKIHYHDLLPVLKTEESLKLIAVKISRIQDYFKRPFAIENISYYWNSPHHEMSETEFISRLITNTGCKLLLDINNVYVNSCNFKFDPLEQIKQLPLDSVIQVHLAGHSDMGDIVIDNHGAHISAEVLALYRNTLSMLGRDVSTLIEWDYNIPSFAVLNAEVIKVKKLRLQCN
jgi:uncharacterized protein (UPF0276 family)